MKLKTPTIKKIINIQEKYLNQIKEILEDFNKEKNLKFFIFGSAIEGERKKIGDIDIGIVGNEKHFSFFNLKEEFEESTLPFSVDIVDFDDVSEEFKNNVFNNKVLWIIR